MIDISRGVKWELVGSVRNWHVEICILERIGSMDLTAWHGMVVGYRT